MRLFLLPALLLPMAAIAARADGADKVPVEFVTQVLEPTGGKIQRPKDWFYTERHGKTNYRWIISKEDASKGEYKTGVSIQTFVGVKEGTGKSAQEFVQDFIDGKKKGPAVQVVKSCEPVVQDLFTRVCFETEEGEYHILYSLFWGNDGLDVAVITVSGAPKELWATYAPVFDRMSAFELIDMKRFEKKPVADLKRTQLIGAWRLTRGGMTEVCTYKADGTYTSVVSQGEKTLAEVEGTWDVKDGTIYFVRMKSTNENIPLGKDTDPVIEITNDYFLVDEGKESDKFERVWEK